MKTNANQEFSVANSSSAVYTQLVTVGVLKNAGSNLTDIVTATTGSVFVAQSPEQFGYDSDGNLTNDGRWAYSWDAENRLIGTETVAGLPAEIPRQKLVFGYDAQSRRISKVVSNWTGSAWAAGTNLRFVYDAWNLVAELNQTNAVVRSYTWGLDLSGSPQGAGGIGGLLLLSTLDSQPSTHFVSYDGNGNVAALLSADSGSLTASYEYSPFGETLRATGPMAKANPFRFSTKYQDAETGLLYYGYRYYQPSTGRWPSRDPIGDIGFTFLTRHTRESETQSQWSFIFVSNNPVTVWDYLGLTGAVGGSPGATLMAALAQGEWGLAWTIIQAASINTVQQAWVVLFVQAVAKANSLNLSPANNAQKAWHITRANHLWCRLVQLPAQSSHFVPQDAFANFQVVRPFVVQVWNQGTIISYSHTGSVGKELMINGQKVVVHGKVILDGSGIVQIVDAWVVKQ